GGEIAARLDEITPIVQPAQLLQTVVVDPARHVVERVAQKMHIAALVSRFRQNLAQRCPQAGVIVGDDKLDPMETARLQPQWEISPAGTALASRELARP